MQHTGSGEIAASLPIRARGKSVQAPKGLGELRLVGEAALDRNLSQIPSGTREACGGELEAAGAQKIARGATEKSPKGSGEMGGVNADDACQMADPGRLSRAIADQLAGDR